MVVRQLASDALGASRRAIVIPALRWQPCERDANNEGASRPSSTQIFCDKPLVARIVYPVTERRVKPNALLDHIPDVSMPHSSLCNTCLAVLIFALPFDDGGGGRDKAHDDFLRFIHELSARHTISSVTGKGEWIVRELFYISVAPVKDILSSKTHLNPTVCFPNN
jgi:hypothetical protein